MHSKPSPFKFIPLLNVTKSLSHSRPISIPHDLPTESVYRLGLCVVDVGKHDEMEAVSFAGFELLGRIRGTLLKDSHLNIEEGTYRPAMKALDISISSMIPDL